MRALLLTLGSFVLTASVIGNAYVQKKQFYPSVVYITKSNPSMAVLYIQAFVFVILMGKLMRKVFFGQLRPAEMEHLIERSWYAVTETCLAFTVFRDDFSPRFVALFTLLLFLKCFHWLAEDRVDYMERSPVISWVFHFRVISLLGMLASVDCFFINHAYYSTLIKGASVQLVFGFEYAILLTAVLTVLVKYILHTIDLQSENPWESKAVYLLYTELVLGFIKVVLYVTFLVIMIKVHTFPLFAIRPTYLTMRAFKKALNDVIMSRRAIRNMNTLYPDATEEELRTGDNVCIICREEMITGCKKLPCNHIFHSSCLRSWFQRQQTCPTCRMDVLRTPRPQQSPPPQQPQPQPQPQPPQPPNFGGMFNGGMFPAGFPMWPPAAPAAPAPQPPASSQQSTTSTTTAPSTSAATTSASSTATPTTAASASATPTFPTSMPSFMPPPFMSVPFSSFAPPPPADLAGLTEEELIAMEGTERRNVEARIQCLRNIHTLLDSAMIHIQQYTHVVSQLGYNNNTSFTQGSTPAPNVNTVTSSHTASTPSSSATTKNSSSPVTSASATSSSKLESSSSSSSLSSKPKLQPDTSYSLPRPLSAYEETGARPKVPKGVTTPEVETIPAWENETEEDGSLNEIRKRRLQRFSSTPSEDQKEKKVSDNLDLD